MVMALLPTVDETPEPLRDAVGRDHLPRLSRRRSLRVQIAFAGTQLLLWVTIGLVFAPLAARLLGEPVDSRRASSIAA